MGTNSPGGPQRCRLILQRCLAIQLNKPGHTPEDLWMYDSGYMIFQNFLAANAQCWWNVPLTSATRVLKYTGHIAPGILLVTAEPCALEVLRSAYARGVLKPPATYVISSVGDIEDCIVTPTVQGQFTPLPEALCDVIMDLTAEGQSATIENIRIKLGTRFPHMATPVTEVIYDSLAQLMQERKIYQTSKGYFIVTPERRRSRSRPRSHRGVYPEFDEDEEPLEARTMLMTNSEALHSLYGEISTERDGDLTHQCIQTNLADVICGGNPNDKIMYPRTSKRRSASFPTPRSLERRHSLRFFGSSKRLQRCASTRSLSKTYAQTLATDSSSSEYQSTDSSSPKKGSLLSRLFRRSGRTKQRQIETFSAQFPPAEWFNSRAVHLHSIGTQTADHDLPVTHTLSNSTFYDGSELSQRSSTLPRRHRRHMSSESAFLISSRDCSPIRRRSPAYCSGSLPRSTQSIPSASVTSTPSRLSQTTTISTPPIKPQTQKTILGKQIFEEKSRPKINTSSITNKDNKFHRSIQSGPSSIESGKATSSIFTSGPSSLESTGCRASIYSKTSGHSSLESQVSTVMNPSPTRSILMLNGSPRGTPRHQALRARAEQNQRNQNRASTPSRILEEFNQMKKNGIPNSNSNNSITLQVTTNNGNGPNSIPSTKIFVQNSPVRSVITLENGKLMENSNVYIINNETTTNERGELIKRNVSSSCKTPLVKENSLSETEANSETCDSISMISESASPDLMETSKFTKNINNDQTMNNNRKLSLTIPQNGSNSIVYKNVLKNNESNSTTPSSLNNFQLENDFLSSAGSVGNLRYFEKNNKLNSHHSNHDLKNLRYESAGNLNLQKGMNNQSANILQKNMIAVGSEPNLAMKQNQPKDIKSNCIEKSVEKESMDRRLSGTNDELYNFPSLTDLSFNFTSLAAQKILQGVSLNSIDTLVELNIAANGKDKPQNVNNNTTTPAVCTDYGLV